MTTPDRAPERRRPRRLQTVVLLAVVVLLLLAYLVAALLFARSAGNRGLTIQATPKPNGAVVLLDVVTIDPGQSSVRARLELVPGDDLSDSTGQLKTSIALITSLQGNREFVFPAGQRPAVQDVTLFVAGAAEDYPLDHWSTLFAVFAFHPTAAGAEPGPGDEVPTSIGVESSIPGWTTRQISLEEFLTDAPEASLEGDVGYVALRYTRAGSTLAIVFLVLGLMVVLAVVGVAVALAVARGRRRLEPTLAGFLAALLFALIPLRAALPGAPPLGAWIDILVFFWVEIALMSALALFVTTWLQRGPRPDPPADEPASPLEELQPAAAVPDKAVE